MTARQNIERLLKHLGLDTYVIIFEEHEDRVYAAASACLKARLIAKGWELDPGNPALLHPNAVESWREPNAVMPAMQICFRNDGTVDIDIDLANPLGGDVASAVVHGLEVFWHWLTGRKSNQKRIAKWLDRRLNNA